MESKTQKDLEDEYFLKLEKKMERQSKITDKLFGLDYDEIYKKKETKQEISKKGGITLYETVIIILFIMLGILSIYYERQVHIVVIRISLLSFLVGFSPNADVPGKLAPLKGLIPFYNLFYKYHFYKTKWLYTLLMIATIIFTLIYSNIVGKTWSILRFIMRPIIPLTFFAGVFLGRFITEIINFILRAIKGEVDWKKVFSELLLVFMIGLIVRTCIRCDIPGLIEKRI